MIMSLKSYSRILVHHPYILITGITFFSGTCLIISFVLNSLPTFEDPQMGFQTRGTELSEKLMTYKNLIDDIKYSETLVINPRKDMLLEKSLNLKKKHRKKKVKPDLIYTHNIIFNDTNRHYMHKETNWSTLEKLVKNKYLHLQFPELHEDFFCGLPDEGYAHLVYKADAHTELFNLKSLFKLCRLEMELKQLGYYKDLCMKNTPNNPNSCCRPWSLANYVALLNNRISCLAITEDDINSTKELLIKCSDYFHKYKLGPSCQERGHCDAPLECIKYDAVFNILNYLTSASFMSPNQKDNFKLEETAIFLPIAANTDLIPYYQSMNDNCLKYDGISVVAMYFGIKTALFDLYLFKDLWLISASISSVIFAMWIYTGSLFLTLMTIISIIFSLGVAYFLYTIILELSFFPFMNLLVIVIAIGIGADDAFIFCKIWKMAKEEDNSSSLNIMNKTLHHALVSMFVTSSTTAAAFLSSYFSCIIAIRCFGIFAGLTVIVNYIFMITWLPASAVIFDKMHTSCDRCTRCPKYFLKHLCCNKQWNPPDCKLKTFYNVIEGYFQKPLHFIMHNILKLKFIFFIIFTLLSIISSVIVFYKPKLQLPNSNEFELFQESHLFEQYDTVYKNKFHFNRIPNMENETNIGNKFPLRFVWGLMPIDNGDALDPRSLGTLQMDDLFNLSHPDSQRWLLKFCKELRRQSFYQTTSGPLLPNCFIEYFVSWMKRRCTDPFNTSTNRTPCCEISHFPYEASVFETCLPYAIYDLYETPAEFLDSATTAGPIFSKDLKSTIKAAIIEYQSNFSYSVSYNYVNEFVTKVETWMNKQLEGAPEGMRRGWFVTDTEFYDLQLALSKSTIVSFVVTMSLALLVLFLITLNVLISLYAIFVITCSTISCLATLVLTGWQLNVLEVVAISSTVGLIIDFSLHYTVNYRLCPLKENRERATEYSLSKMLGPVSMAAFTTGISGLFMIPSQILAYKQIGQFLVTVMTVSWLYSTFYLCSILAIAAPVDGAGQFYYSNLICIRTYARHRGRNDPNDAPRSRACEMHELQCLHSKLNVQPTHDLTLNGNYDNECPRNEVQSPIQSPSADSIITMVMGDEK